MATFVLTDLAHDVWAESFSIDNQTQDLAVASRWSVSI